MKPPISRCQHDSAAPLFVETATDWRTTFHSLLKKILEAFTCARFREEFMAHGHNVNWLELEGDVQVRRSYVARLLQHDLQARGIGIYL